MDELSREAFFTDTPPCAASGCTERAWQGSDVIPASQYCSRHIAALALAAIRKETA